jgi:uncharacterized membrane protein
MDAKAHPDGGAGILSSDRLASLSDTIFGVAMTLLASTLLPSISGLRGSAIDMLRDLAGPLETIVLSFSIAASYWLVQQRRLAMCGSVTSLQAVLNLMFLFLFVLLPISTGLWGRFDTAARGVVMIYGAHLALIAVVNLLLWIDVHRGAAAHAQILRSSVALALFLAALAVGAIRPQLAQYLWFAVFATTLMGRGLTRRIWGKG